MKNIYVTKSFLPPIEEYNEYIKKIWESGVLTNQGPLLKEFEEKARDYLGVDHFQLVSNGTVALQLALKSLNITGGEVITTPFTYVATLTSLIWERCTPVFVDIEPGTFCIDASKIEESITSSTTAILAVHVFGYPCNVKKIDEVGKRHHLPVIYDGAHAFGVKYQGRSLLDYGDITTCSFHATKLMHTIEGGCIVSRHNETDDAIELLKRFGHNGDDHKIPGINAKASEFQAAMGLCNLGYIQANIEQRRSISFLYDNLLKGRFRRPVVANELDYNYAYYPILLDDERSLLLVIKALNAEGIYPRRYFFPSLNTLAYLEQYQSCPVSEDVASRILCLPLYVGLEKAEVKRICKLLLSAYDQ